MGSFTIHDNEVFISDEEGEISILKSHDTNNKD